MFLLFNIEKSVLIFLSNSVKTTLKTSKVCKKTYGVFGDLIKVESQDFMLDSCIFCAYFFITTILIFIKMQKYPLVIDCYVLKKRYNAPRN
jgi:hypothetical protein